MKGKRYGGLFSMLSALILAAGLMAGPGTATAQAAGPGPEVCANCHADAVKSYASSKHGTKGDARSPASAGACSTCHGDGSAHVKAGGGKGSIMNPASKTLASDQKNGVCLTCHQKGRINWQGSKHQTNEVACSSCHAVHQGKDKVLNKAAQTEVCFACHKTERAQMNRASVHPVRSGQLGCSSCHNPHGTAGPAQLIKNTVNETCYTCHAEKRGPFLWDHPVASDNCSNCHTPHGSNHAPLLQARAPNLCASCHQTAGQGHPNTVRSGAGIPPAGAQAQIAFRACLNCHTQVHGSNHPSGARFSR
ncbi:MAG: DmsE family decaheme c-type cytochrome [Burkholderiales bacterium]|nr:DmsE family decaheme c-type cytochrome [Burkholderiales bacterium]